jgi:hypothetical protein
MRPLVRGGRSSGDGGAVTFTALFLTWQWLLLLAAITVAYRLHLLATAPQ